MSTSSSATAKASDQPTGLPIKTSNRSVSIVIPVYRSSVILPELIDRLLRVMETRSCPFEVILVDDASPDDSWQTLQELKQRHPQALKIVRLARNVGQHGALLCGLGIARYDVIVTMDDDLQHLPEDVPRLLNRTEEGFDLVIAAYDEKQHAALRNRAGGMVDGLLRCLFRLPGDFQLTSFRAVDRIVVREAGHMGGGDSYMTAMLLTHASRPTNVAVTHNARKCGESNYTWRRSFSLAANLIFSYSNLPLYAVAGLCVVAFLFAVAYGLYVLIQALTSQVGVPGWASTIVVLSFLNALILASLVIFGVYLSRLNAQVSRSRVPYSVREIND